jgi:predicted transcriptional regulator
MKQEQTKILLSIKPQYAELIFTGKKKFEFRRTIFKNRNVKTIIVYASSPVLQSDLKSLWKVTKEFAGIDKDLFYEYFNNKQDGFAIKIAKTRRYRKPLCIKEDFKLFPPQSFLYLHAQSLK